MSKKRRRAARARSSPVRGGERRGGCQRSVGRPIMLVRRLRGTGASLLAPRRRARFFGGGEDDAVAHDAAADEQRAALHLLENLGDVLAEQRDREQVDRAEKEDDDKRG